MTRRSLSQFSVVSTAGPCRICAAAVTAEQWPEMSEAELIKNIQSVQICLGEEEMEIIIRIKGLQTELFYIFLYNNIKVRMLYC